MPQMNARPPLGFQNLAFPQQAAQKFNLDAMIESLLLVQQKI